MAHSWRFFLAGGFDQVRLDSGADIAALAELDPKLWVALACPAKGIEVDPHTLQLLDTDSDGRVRVPEVIAAATWACAMLKSPDALMKASPELPLDAINDATPEGRQVLASAREILKNLGRPDAKAIGPADTADTVKIFAATLFNGDGVIVPESAEADGATRDAVADVMATVGAVKDVSARDGIDTALVATFFEQSATFTAWWKKGEGDKQVMPLGDATVAAHAAWVAVKPKVDDFFARCALAQMEGRATVLNAPEAELVALAGLELSDKNVRVAALPLAKIEGGRALPLSEGLNPAWASAIADLKTVCVVPLIGERATLSFADWNALAQKLAGHVAWQGTKPASAVEKLGIARLKALSAGDARARIEALITKDKALEGEAKAIGSVDRLVHYHRDLARFLNNFVAFKEFYTRTGKATFQAGTLYCDGRSLDLCMRVEDIARHAAVAADAMTFLAYCECVRRGSSGAEKMNIAAAFTAGDGAFLTVGRNGVFYDRVGRDWDATIVRIVEQPISVRQAFWTPYRRISKFVSDQIEKTAAAKDKESTEGLTGEAAKVAQPAKEPSGFDIAKFAGVFAAIGLAVGAIGTAAAAILTGFLGLKLWQMPLAFAGAAFLISGPSMLLAAMKLRHRNLAPLLDANGWAINARARINIPFGGSLTQLAAFPAGSQRSRVDPYADKKQPWAFYVVLAIIALTLGWYCWRTGQVEKWRAAIVGEAPDAGVVK